MSGSLIDVGDIPVPEAVDRGNKVNDEISGELAYKLAFVGLGQAGGRLAAHYYGLGYRRVVAINTAKQDLDSLNLPAANKLDLGTGGAGKDPAVALKAITGREEDVHDLFKRCLGDEVDYALVCFGAGGGTGSGTWPVAVSVLRAYFDGLRRPARIGGMVALPKNEEGTCAAQNAAVAFDKIKAAQPALSPLLVVDNEKLSKVLYPRTAIDKFWTISNNGFCTLLHLFNRIAATSSEYKPLDKIDFATIMDSGSVVLGSTIIKPCDTESDVAKAMRDQLLRNTVVDVDLSKGTRAALVFVGGPSVFSKLPVEFLDYSAAAISRMLAPGAVVHHALYPGAQDDLRCYVMVGGLGLPEVRLQELRKRTS